MSNNGLITIPSIHNVKDTIDLIESDVKSKGLTIFARVDHAAGAKEVGLPLTPTLLLIFGNAKGGTPLMQTNQQVGIDLPLKVLVWGDASGKTWLSYNDPTAALIVFRLTPKRGAFCAARISRAFQGRRQRAAMRQVAV